MSKNDRGQKETYDVHFSIPKHVADEVPFHKLMGEGTEGMLMQTSSYVARFWKREDGDVYIDRLIKAVEGAPFLNITIHTKKEG